MIISYKINAVNPLAEDNLGKVEYISVELGVRLECLDYTRLSVE